MVVNMWNLNETEAQRGTRSLLRPFRVEKTQTTRGQNTKKGMGIDSQDLGGGGSRLGDT